MAERPNAPVLKTGRRQACVSSNLTVRASVIDDAALAKYALLAVAGGAVAYGIWQFIKREPPRNRPTLFPLDRR